MKAEDFQHFATPCETATGFVVLLDALGVRAMSGADIDRFMEQRRFILAVLKEILPVLNSWRSQERLTRSARVPNLLVFGDTFAITWAAPSSHPYTFLREVQEFGAAISYVVALAFIAGLRLRGAIAYGEFLYDADVIVGPAVAEAAEWYEEAQWIGVIATPATARAINAALSDPAAATPDPEENLGSLKDLLLPLRQDFARLFYPAYDVPFRDCIRSMQCINWPYSLFCLGPDITSITGEHVSTFFLNKLRAFARPASAQPKYDNTASFFEFCVRHTQKIEARSFSLALQRTITSDIPLDWFPTFLARYTQPQRNDERGKFAPA